MPRKKKRAAWGSLTQIDSTTWRLRFWASGPDGYKRRSKTIRNATRLDAERARSELMLAHSEDAPCPTVGEVWDSYAMPDLVRRVEGGDASPGTLRQYGSWWRRHVEPTWAAVQCDQVRALAVQQWLYGLPLNAARAGLSLLRIVLDYAVRYELCGHNVARERYLMPSASTVNAMDDGIWSLDGLRETWDAVRGRWFEAAFLLCAFGGLRVGEALGVRSENVRAATVGGQALAVVSVRRQVSQEGVTDVLKTPQSRRAVPIAGSAGRRLIRLAAASDGYLSGDGMGNPSTRARLTKAWRACPLPDGMRHPMRNLRNSWQTWMRWEMRVPVWAIEPIMGHRVAGVTGEHYDRPQEELFCEVVAEAYAARPYDAGWDVGE